jgi:hypothetical protein
MYYAVIWSIKSFFVVQDVVGSNPTSRPINIYDKVQKGCFTGSSPFPLAAGRKLSKKYLYIKHI